MSKNWFILHRARDVLRRLRLLLLISTEYRAFAWNS